MLDKIRAAAEGRINTEDGATAVEYALMVAAIAALIIIIVFALGGQVSETFDETCTAIASGGTGTSGGC